MRAACEGPRYAYTECFIHRQGIVLTVAAVRRWARTLGVTVAAIPIGPGESCGRPHGVYPRATFYLCQANGKIGIDEVSVEVTSLVGDAGPPVLLPRGTQIVVHDIGH